MPLFPNGFVQYLRLQYTLFHCFVGPEHLNHVSTNWHNIQRLPYYSRNNSEREGGFIVSAVMDWLYNSCTVITMIGRHRSPEPRPKQLTQYPTPPLHNPEKCVSERSRWRIWSTQSTSNSVVSIRPYVVLLKARRIEKHSTGDYGEENREAYSTGDYDNTPIKYSYFFYTQIGNSI